MVPQPTVKTVQGWTCQLMESGVVDFRRHFAMRVFNPLAPSNRNHALAAVYRKHKLGKKQAYQQEVEHSSFTPLVHSATGGMGNEATIFYKRLALLLAQKWDSPYSTPLCWLLRYSLLHSSFQAIRGTRSSQGHAVRPPTAIDLVTTESHIQENDQ